MKLLSLFSIAALSCLPSIAFAEGLEEVGGDSPSNRVGVGVEATLQAPFPLGGGLGTPAGGLAVSYDASKFRIDGLLFLSHVDDVGTAFALGGRAFFVVDKGRVADFSLGGGLALGIVAPSGGGDSTVGVSLEGALQLRVFLATNVALSATAGIGLAFGHGGSFVFTLGGQLNGALGIVYYF